MVEYEGICIVGLDPALVAAHVVKETGYEAKGIFGRTDTPYQPRDRSDEGGRTWILSPASKIGHIVGPLRAAMFYRRTQETATKTGRLAPRHTRKGTTALFEGMFTSRDKLARIGVVCTLTGIPLGNTDVILNGINHREIVKTDHRGVWWKYLEIDEYPDALFISSNGIVYALLEQTERLPDNEGIFDQVVRRRTIANATHRQFHRKFI